MSQSEPDHEAPQPTRPADVDYEPPRITVLGSVVELTQGVNTGAADAGGLVPILSG